MTEHAVPVYPKISYDYDKIALKCIYRNEKEASFPAALIHPESARRVFGDLGFPDPPADRVYTMASFVTSIDGKVAFPDDPAGPVVAKANILDPDGAEADFWILNLFRANADIVIGGAGTLQMEPNGLACIFDQDLEDERANHGLSRLPWVMICSLDGTDIPFGDTLFENQPYIIHTSPAGTGPVTKGMRHDHYIVGPYASVFEAAADRENIQKCFRENLGKRFPVLITGTGNTTDPHAALGVLKYFGMDRAIVESPSYTHALMGAGLLDEIVLNYSCLFIGGTAVGLGSGMNSYTSTDHPHTEMLSIHMHSPSFFYFRHRMVYGLRKG